MAWKTVAVGGQQTTEQVAPASTAPTEGGRWKTVAVGASDDATASAPATSNIVSEVQNDWISTPITDAELEVIAKRHGVDPTELGSFAAARGGILASTDALTEVKEAGKQALGMVGETLAAGLPQKISQKLQTPGMEAAIDELRTLIDTKKSTLQRGSELVTEIAGGIALPTAAFATKAPILAGAGLGAAQGAVSGYSHAARQDEASAAATGALMGAGVGAAAGTLVKGLGKLLAPKAGKIAATEDELIDAQIKFEESAKEVLGEELQTARRQLEETLDAAVPEMQQKINAIEILRKQPADEVFDPKKLLKSKEYMESQAEEILRRADEKMAKGGITQARAEAEAATEILDEDASFLRQFSYYLKYGKQFGKDVNESSIRKVSNEEVMPALRELPDADLEDEMFNFYKLKTLTEGPLAVRIHALEQNSSDALKRLLDIFRDGRYTAAAIDRRHPGITLAPVLDEGAMAQKMHTLNVVEQLGDVKEVNKVLRKQPDWEKKSREIYEALDKGTAAPEGGEELVDSYRKFFADAFDRVNALSMKLNGKPLIVGSNKNYVPHMAMNFVESSSAIEKQLVKQKEKGIDLLSDANLSIDKLREDAKKLGEEWSVEEVIRSVQYLANREQIPLNKMTDMDLLEFRKAFNLLGTKDAQSGLSEILARSAFKREGDIPLLIRERRLPILTQQWVLSTSRAAHLQQAMDSLKKQRNELVAVGDVPGAQFVDNLMKDLAGGRTSTLKQAIRSGIERGQISLLKAAARTNNSAKKKVLETSAEFPLMLNGFMQQFYPSFLGLPNVASAFTNLGNIMAYTVPEMGYKYAAPRAAAAYANVIKKAATGGFTLADGTTTRSIKRYLEDAGFRGAEVTDMAAALDNSVITNPALAGTVDKVKKMNTVLMFLFEASENLNKAVALELADNVAYDAWMKKAPALDFVKNIQAGTKRILRDAYQEGDFNKFQSEMRKYLIGKTILNYDQFNMSEFGRAVGPFFSMFTKWPTTMVGDVTEQFATKGLTGGSVEVGRKLLLPVIALSALNWGTEDVDNPVLNAIKGRGKQGFVRMAPLTAVAGLAEGKFASPPILEGASGAVQVLSGDVDKGLTKIGKFATGVTPGASVIKWLYDQLEGE